MASLKSEERWQTKISTVLERNKYIFNNRLVLSDIKFTFPDTETTIPAHKHVLAVSSPVFFTMFFGDLAETRDTIDITDCDSDIFLRFLRFIYCDEATFEDIDCAVKVWYLADKYDVPSLAKECVVYLDGNMDPLSAFDVLTYARQFSDESLETACWEVIDYNAEAIVADDSFLDVKHESLSSFVERSSARIKETTIFNALDRWAAKRCEEASMTVNGENKRAFMGEDLLKQFRFSLMSPNEFSDVVLPTEILLLTEVIDVFKQFTSVSIPGGFKFSLCPRKTCDEPLHSHSTGNVHDVPGAATSLVNEKSGLLTFTVNRDSSLSGVKIVTDKGQESCRVSLSIAQGGKKMRQIQDKHFTCKDHQTSNYGEINVVFNRPFCLSKNTCYTIKTETDTTNNLDSGFVCWSKSFACISPSQLFTSSGSATPSKGSGAFDFSSRQSGFSFGGSSSQSSSPFCGASCSVRPARSGFFGMTSAFASPTETSSSDKTDKDDIISCHCFGNCDKNCPEHSGYGGEIMELFLRG